MKKMYLVWNGADNECVGFDNEADAHFTATGDDSRCEAFCGIPAVPMIGEEFRSAYGEQGDLRITVVEVPA